MKKFKVTVEGKAYLVEVEEINTAEAVASPQTLPRTAGKAANHSPMAVQPVNKNPAMVNPSSVMAAEGDFTLKAPMPGSVLDVRVAAGDQVTESDVLIVLEAMKMENELTAPQAGTVKEVLVKKGNTVNSGDPLIILS